METFLLLKEDGAARRGRLFTPHGTVETPAFMNVGTAAAIRGGLSSLDLLEIGCQMELSNTYHLHIRPGEEVIAALGGLHRFMDWEKPVLTDSGGFQVFSLGHRRKIREEGVTFSSYIDGKSILMTPESSMQIQSKLGSDIAMAFDECVGLPCEKSYAKASAERTLRWLERCIKEHGRLAGEEGNVNPGQLLFGIGQGATFTDLRVENVRALRSMELDGFAIGGLSVGESAGEMHAVLDAVLPEMPREKPRYLMGVGTPVDLLEGIWRGVDLFDCVLPGTLAHHGNLFTFSGRRRLLKECYKTDPLPPEEGCNCPTCRHFSRGYIRHLLKSDERLGMRLCLLHNLYFYNRLTLLAREAIEAGRFEAFYREYRDILGKEDAR